MITVSLVPAGEGASVLRALRIIRALRLISVVPSMRAVTVALLRAVPRMGAVLAMLVVIFYIAAVMATKLFGGSYPDWFGDIGRSAFTLFQIMTLESWSMGIVRPVMAEFPYAWAFFVPFILVSTFAVLNLFIAIIVDAMQATRASDDEDDPAKASPESADALAPIERLERDIQTLKQQVRGNA